MTPAAARRRRDRAGPSRLAATLLAAVLAAGGGAASTAAPAYAELTAPPEPTVDGPVDGWPSATDVDATAYVLLEAATGQVLAASDADVRRPVASTIKVLTALSVVERRDLADEVTTGPEVAAVPGSGVGLTPGDTWTIEELLDALLSRSGNEAAEALAVEVGGDTQAFLELMEQDAAALGVGDLELVSPSGLDDQQQLSALELATLARVALADERLRPFLAREEVTLPSVGTVESRNELLARYEDATGVKTGFTLAAGNSLIGSAERDGRELVAVVLDAGEDPARFEHVGQLLDLGFEEYATSELAGELALAVAGGEVLLRVAPVTVTAPEGIQVELDLPVTARPPETAPSVAVRTGEGDDGPLALVPSELVHAGAPDPSGDARAEADDATEAPGDGEAEELGRALVDGAYAALRSAAVRDRLR